MRSGIKVFLFTTLLVLATTEARAMYTPNPAGRWDQGHFFLAGDLQWNGDKDLEHGELDDEVGLFARPAYTFGQNAIIYGRVGFQDASHLDAAFAIGGGVQMSWVLPQATDWAIGGSFDYLFWDLDHADYHEIQFAPAVSYNIPQIRELTPYAGLAFDFLVDDLEEDDPVGMLFGTNYDLDRWRFDAQFRVINEEGLFVSAGYTF